jgi:hypothetical protein
MSRNLCQSSCCGNILRLSDLRGKPIEFRRYYKSPPVIGTKWDCPTCKTAYFAWWRDAQWQYSTTNFTNFVIDLSYYESFNDEPGYPEDMENPRHLCLDNAEDVQDIWGS